MYRVRAVLRTEMGTYLEYTTPTLPWEEAKRYASAHLAVGNATEIVPAGGHTVAVREIVPK